MGKIAIILIIIFGIGSLLRPGSPTNTSRPTATSVPAEPQAQANQAQPLPSVNDLQLEDPKPLATEEVREVQTRLKALGFDAGAIDGLPGPRTTLAIKQYQTVQKRLETGTLDRLLLNELRRAAGPPVGFQPAMTLRVEGPSQPTIYGSTNLPDGAQLIVSITRPESKYMAQDTVVVRNGQFKTARFSSLGKPLNPGTYSVSVTMSLAELQDAAVRAVVGSKGERMNGPLVKRGSLGPTIEYASSIAVPGGVSPQLDALARQKAADDLKQWVVQSCNDNVDLINRMVRSGLVVGREFVGTERDKRVANCISEMNR
ncbi:peptidoglycan-binding protein [Reyranella sp.]|uniref:peptidoglycan-binding domain-containing protein n=1 Tax=Reyranella sp. TaxID=1929291 RepID=UPI002730B59E|nr:peptidoglycan-binding protein [Reyranella sp.]MDP2374405.1 peptidoglycan-binding domain-containing protein [Reyranella sp.]